MVSLKKVEPSGTAKRNWVIQQAQLEGQIEKLTKARMAFEALAVYKEAFFFLGELHSAITRDLATHIELRNQLAKGTALRVILEDLALNTVHIIDPSTSNIIHTVTRNEKLLLLNLLKKLANEGRECHLVSCIEPKSCIPVNHSNLELRRRGLE